MLSTSKTIGVARAGGPDPSGLDLATIRIGGTSGMLSAYGGQSIPATRIHIEVTSATPNVCAGMSYQNPSGKVL